MCIDEEKINEDLQETQLNPYLKIKNTKGKKNLKMKPTTKRTRAKTKTGQVNSILKERNPDLVGLGLSTILSIQEANAIATGEINADTLKQYKHIVGDTREWSS